MSSADLIIEYSRNPPNKEILKDATIRYREPNRVCADVVEVFLVIENNILKKFAFDGSDRAAFLLPSGRHQADQRPLYAGRH